MHHDVDLQRLSGLVRRIVFVNPRVFSASTASVWSIATSLMFCSAFSTWNVWSSRITSSDSAVLRMVSRPL
jgi:hypothetical protein